MSSITNSPILSKLGDNHFKKWIENTFLPCGIVFSTKSSKEIIEKNNITPSQFIRPFGDYINLEIKIKDNNYNNENDFKIDFYDSDNFCKNENDISIYLNNCLSYENNIPKFNLNSISLNKKNYSSFIQNQKSFSQNYYNEFEKIIFEYCNFNENEFYQQPLIFIYFIGMNDTIDSIKEMKKNLPKLLIEIYDIEMIDLIILLNDKSDKNKYEANIEKKNNKLNNLQTSFDKSKVIYLEINGNKNLENNNYELFSKYFHKIEFYNGDYKKKILGQLITKEEINNIKQELNSFFQNEFAIKILKKITLLEDLKNKKNVFYSLFNKLSIEKSNYFNSYKFKGYQKAQLTLGILYFYLRMYKEAYIYIKKLYKSIENQTYPKLETSLLQLKTIIKFIIKGSEKNKINKDQVIESYTKNSHLFSKSKIYVGTIRALLIYLKMLEEIVDFDHINLFHDYITKYSSIFLNFDYNLIYYLIQEKLCYYYLYTDFPLIRIFVKDSIQSLTYLNEIKVNITILYNYILNFVGIFCDTLKLQENINDNIQYSFFSIKKYLTSNLIKLCNKIKYEKGVKYFYLILLKLYKIPESLKLTEEERIINQEEYLEFFTEMTKIILGIEFLDDSDIINFDKSSILIITKREENILKKKHKNSFYKNFKKYHHPKINKVYTLLSENDLLTLKYIDKIIKEEETFNYYIRKKIEIYINETIRIKFNFSNPFPIDDKYEKICFLFDNEKIVECEKVNLSIRGLSKSQVELSVKFIRKRTSFNYWNFLC